LTFEKKLTFVKTIMVGARIFMALLSLIFSLVVLASYSSLTDLHDSAHYPKASCAMPGEA